MLSANGQASRSQFSDGLLARAATRLGEAGINIDYGYCGVDPNTNATMLLLGVADAGKAAKVLEQAAAAGAAT